MPKLPDSTSNGVKQIIVSSFDDLTHGDIEESQDLNAFPNTRDRTLAYIIDQKGALMEWSSDIKDRLYKVSITHTGGAKTTEIERLY